MDGRLLMSALGLACLMSVAGMAAVALPQQPEQWTVPRTEHGHPDLQGNWTNATMTPVQRPAGVGPVLTAEQVAALERLLDQRVDLRRFRARATLDRGHEDERDRAGRRVLPDPIAEARPTRTGRVQILDDQVRPLAL